MRNSFFLLCTLILCGAVLDAPLAAQAVSSAQSTVTATPRIDLSLGYDHTRANAPPAGCQCFGLNGGYVSATVHLTNWLSVEGVYTGQHASNISLLGQDLNLLTYTGGVKVNYPGHRWVPFVDGTVGQARGYSSYFPANNALGYTTSATSLAYTAGGGVDYSFNRRFAVRGFADFLQTQFPNGTANNTQNHLSTGVGIVYKIGMISNAPRHHAARQQEEPAPLEEQIQLSCTSSVRMIDQGDTLEVDANIITQPPNLNITYSWASDGGVVSFSGRRVLLDTANVPAGVYHVKGHASADGHPNLTADCDVAFRIKSTDESLRSPTAPPADEPKPDPNLDRDFRANMKDALFDYDKDEIRPDAQAAIDQDAKYLLAHPDMDVLIGGYADDRGSAEYNLVLGERRAESARHALIVAGIGPERLRIISYGKEIQVCTAENEACRQQNRRAGFSLHP